MSNPQPASTEEAFTRPAMGWKHRLRDCIPSWLVTNRLPRGSPQVLLTFDDGPSPAAISGVLERLAAHRARAIFFVIGQRIAAAPEVLKEIVAAGHEIGNHTFYHHDHDVLPHEKASRFHDFREDIALCQQEIAKHTNHHPRWFRPPGGRLNMNSLLAPRILKLRTMTWRREVFDWRFRTAEEACRGGMQLAQIVQPRDIVLMHDERPIIHDLLDVLLPELKRRGFDLHSGLDAL